MRLCLICRTGKLRKSGEGPSASRSAQKVRPGNGGGPSPSLLPLKTAAPLAVHQSAACSQQRSSVVFFKKTLVTSLQWELLFWVGLKSSDLYDGLQGESHGDSLEITFTRKIE